MPRRQQPAERDPAAPTGPVRVVLLAIAEGVRPRSDGRLDIVGAAPEGVFVPTLPFQAKLATAFVLGTAPADASSPVPLTLVLSSDADGVISRRKLVVAAADPRYPHLDAEGAAVHRCHAIALTVDLGTSGGHSLAILDADDLELARVSFAVTVGTNGDSPRVVAGA